MVLKARTSYFIFSLLIAIHVIGCNAFAPPERKDTAGTIPPTYSLYTAEAGYGQRWWRSFNDAELSRLVEAGLADNFSIQQEHHPISEGRRIGVMGDHHNGLPIFIAGIPQQFQETITSRCIQIPCWFIGQ